MDAAARYDAHSLNQFAMNRRNGKLASVAAAWQAAHRMTRHGIVFKRRLLLGTEIRLLLTWRSKHHWLLSIGGG